MHLVIVQETVGRLLLGAAGEESPAAAGPDAAPRDAPSRSNRFRKRPSARSERWNSRRAQLASSSTARAGNDPGARTGARRSVCSQPASRPRSHTRFGSAAPADPGGRPAVRPTHSQPRRPVARRPAATASTHVSNSTGRTPWARFPVRSHTRCRPAQHVRGQVRHPHPAQQEKPVVGDHLPDVRPARAVVPAQVPVARPQPQRRRHKAQHPQRPRRRLQQIRQAAARRPAPARADGPPPTDARTASAPPRSPPHAAGPPPNSAKLPQNSVSPSHTSPAPRPQPPRGGPGCAGGSVNPNCAARCGKALRAEAAHSAPRGFAPPVPLAQPAAQCSP